LEDNAKISPIIMIIQKKVSTLVGLVIIIAFSVVSFGGAFAYEYLLAL